MEDVARLTGVSHQTVSRDPVQPRHYHGVGTRQATTSRASTHRFRLPVEIGESQTWLYEAALPTGFRVWHTVARF
jgi:hypothetical protein